MKEMLIMIAKGSMRFIAIYVLYQMFFTKPNTLETFLSLPFAAMVLVGWLAIAMLMMLGV